MTSYEMLRRMIKFVKQNDDRKTDKRVITLGKLAKKKKGGVK